MIGLEKDGIFLDMDPRARINFRFVSPVFAREIKDNTHSLNFSLPSSDHNRNQLGFYDLPIVRNAATEKDFRVWLDGIPAFPGVLRISRSQPQSYSARWLSGMSPIAEQLKNTKLAEIDLGGVRSLIGAGAPASQEYTLTKLVDGGVTAIEVNGFLYSRIWSPAKEADLVLTALAGDINNDNANSHVDAAVLGTGAGASIVLTPSPGYSQLDININHPQNEQRWNDVSQAGSALVIHSQIVGHMNTVAAAAAGTYEYTFCPVYNPGFYNNLNADYLGYVNLYDWGGSTFLQNSIIPGQEWRNSAVPFPQAAYLLQQGLAHIGYTDISTFTGTADFQEIHFWNNVSLDLEADESGTPFNRFQSELNLANHVHPDMTLADLLVWMRDEFNLSIDVDYQNKTIDFIPKNDVATNPAVDWTSRSTPAYIFQRTPESKRGYSFSFLTDENDATFGGLIPQLDGVSIDAGFNKIEVKFPPMANMDDGHPVLAGNWKVPTIRQVGNTPYPDVEADEWMPRPFFMRGMHPSSTAQNYPLGTHGNLDYAGTSVGSYGLTWKANPGESDTSIIEGFWNGWVIDREEEATIEMVLSPRIEDIITIPYHQPVILATEDGYIRVAIMQISTGVSSNGIETTQLKALRL